MCLIGISLDRSTSGGPELLIAANRDEFHGRAAQPAHWWPDRREIYAGRDLSAGGTWLGISRLGRFAAVTNVRMPGAAQASRSRGELPVEFLQSARSAEEYSQEVTRTGKHYGPFNLLTWDGQELWCASNQQPEAIRVADGIHGLSNAGLDTPWPKVKAVCHVLGDVLGDLLDESQPRSLPTESLINALGRREVPSGELPDTGVGADLEQRLAPMFICSPDYGTRCSTVLSLGPAGIEITEVSYNASGHEVGRVAERINAP